MTSKPKSPRDTNKVPRELSISASLKLPTNLAIINDPNQKASDNAINDIIQLARTRTSNNSPKSLPEVPNLDDVLPQIDNSQRYIKDLVDLMYATVLEESFKDHEERCSTTLIEITQALGLTTTDLSKTIEKLAPKMRMIIRGTVNGICSIAATTIFNIQHIMHIENAYGITQVISIAILTYLSASLTLTPAIEEWGITRVKSKLSKTELRAILDSAVFAKFCLEAAQDTQNPLDRTILIEAARITGERIRERASVDQVQELINTGQYQETKNTKA